MPTHFFHLFDISKHQHVNLEKHCWSEETCQRWNSANLLPQRSLVVIICNEMLGDIEGRITEKPSHIHLIERPQASLTLRGKSFAITCAIYYKALV